MIGRHCDPDELIDVIDGLREEASLPHLAACPACRAQLEDLRATLASLEAVGVPEPSPLFWTHLSTRVRDAIAKDPQPRPASASRAWPVWKITVPSLAAAAVLILAIVTWPSIDRRGHAVRDGSGTGSATPALALPSISVDAADDASIGLMMELASTVDLDSAADAGLMTTAGATDAAVLDLSSEEQRELERLLNEAMNRPGA